MVVVINSNLRENTPHRTGKHLSRQRNDMVPSRDMSAIVLVVSLQNV